MDFTCVTATNKFRVKNVDAFLSLMDKADAEDLWYNVADEDAKIVEFGSNGYFYGLKESKLNPDHAANQGWEEFLTALMPLVEDDSAAVVRTLELESLYDVAEIVRNTGITSLNFDDCIFRDTYM